VEDDVALVLVREEAAEGGHREEICAGTRRWGSAVFPGVTSVWERR
jgi:hypothetical protein